ncbi:MULTISPECIES: hypothetical protein [Nocardiopsidaceae]|jgi:hypothetical protein|uniref:Uncharacterized protein n=2 Tax=Nocardiopsidaceae TaxID=83676 RepID=A0ABY6YUH5_9ACTN|nr:MULTISPECIES: hypothetical protein [Nocardiopsaceae]MEE2050876.1 hypothetical protein [Nocardiopsis umidischolae]WAE75749.1 hypothetical protein OUQ99_12025 [Streptomonospora nanhaiensis]
MESKQDEGQGRGYEDGDDPIQVCLVGGPRAWSGLVMEDVFTRDEILGVPWEDLGADLVVPGDVRPDPPVARYRPLDGTARWVWHFTGWEPPEAEPVAEALPARRVPENAPQ